MKRSARARPRPCPRLRDRSAKGEWAEAAFLTKALGLGFIVCRPFSDNHRFDFLVISQCGRISRIQVKSAWSPRRDGGYRLEVRPRGRRYGPGEIDFVVAYIVPYDIWYIIPVSEVQWGAPTFFPRVRRSRVRWEPYREAWRLLRS